MIKDRPLELLGDREGAGKATFPNGDVYEGEYSNGVREGVGKYSYAAPPPGEEEEPKPPVAEYDGCFTRGEKAMVGTMTYASGHKYHGSWKGGTFNGEGTMFYPNGDLFTGKWSSGVKQGMGTYIFKATATKVTGQWASNVLVSGTFSDAFGNQYAGSFESDSSASTFAPDGVFTLASGAVAAA